MNNREREILREKQMAELLDKVREIYEYLNLDISREEKEVESKDS